MVTNTVLRSVLQAHCLGSACDTTHPWMGHHRIRVGLMIRLSTQIPDGDRSVQGKHLASMPAVHCTLVPTIHLSLASLPTSRCRERKVMLARLSADLSTRSVL